MVESAATYHIPQSRAKDLHLCPNPQHKSELLIFIQQKNKANE